MVAGKRKTRAMHMRGSACLDAIPTGSDTIASRAETCRTCPVNADRAISETSHRLASPCPNSGKSSLHTGIEALAANVRDLVRHELFYDIIIRTIIRNYEDSCNIFLAQAGRICRRWIPDGKGHGLRSRRDGRAFRNEKGPGGSRQDPGGLQRIRMPAERPCRRRSRSAFRLPCTGRSPCPRDRPSQT